MHNVLFVGLLIFTSFVNVFFGHLAVIVWEGYSSDTSGSGNRTYYNFPTIFISGQQELNHLCLQ